jgi:hypothetical protein
MNKDGKIATEGLNNYMPPGVYERTAETRKNMSVAKNSGRFSYRIRKTCLGI